VRALGISFFIFLGCVTHAQNLVPNNSFENYVSCPNGLGEIIDAVSWTNPTWSTPDYYNSCAPINSGCSVPSNAGGYHMAFTGNAYAGLITYSAIFPNSRDYIQVKLLDSLILGKEYCISYYVSLSKIVQLAANGFSAYLSTYPVASANQNILPYSAQVNYAGNIITDTINWVLISGTVIARGGESYLTIGNFSTDANTSTSIVNQSGSGGAESYYYIDDVYVGTCDTLKPPEIISFLTVPNIFTPNNDGANDVFKITQSHIQTLDCSIYDRWGVKLWELKNPDESWDGTTKAGVLCGDGVYYYVLNATGLDGKKYALNGFLQLMR